MLNECTILNCKQGTPGSVALIQDPKMGCAYVPRGDTPEKKKQVGVYLELLCCWIMTGWILLCVSGGLGLVSTLECRRKRWEGRMPQGNSGLILLFCSPSSPRNPQDNLCSLFRICSSSDLETGLVGWLGNLNNLLLNDILRQLIVSHLDPDPIFGWRII